MSIIPSQLQLITNQRETEQNQTVTLTAKVLDQYGNPIAGQDISLFMDHPDFTTQIFLRQEMTDIHGSAFFELTLRNVGDSMVSAQCGTLASPILNIRVLSSLLPPSGPRTWPGVVRSMSRLQVDLNTLMGVHIGKDHHPTKQELCVSLGLDYDKADDRNKMSQALYTSKLWFDYLWRVLYQPSSSYAKDFSALMSDSIGYSNWKNDSNSPAAYMKIYYHLSDDEIRDLWVLSKMWDRFVQTANQFNIHLFVGYREPHHNTWRYKQPNFWEYVEKQIMSASRLGKGLQTILRRHRDLGMILTSGEPISRALEQARDVHKMITDRTMPKFRCIPCWRAGQLVELASQDEFVNHVKQKH